MPDRRPSTSAGASPRAFTLAITAVTLLTVGCFDSTWIQEPRSQRRVAAHETPGALSASPPTGTTAPAKTLKVRAWATPQYASQTIDWKHQLRETLDEANRVLASTAGARLELTVADTWSPPVPQDHLDEALAALEAKDPGRDTDWVLGMVGGLPKATRSFHDLGVGRLFGKHMVVRAASRAAEIDAMETFDKLSAEERLAVVSARKRHRASAVLLHEVAHTLGAIHETDKTSLMHPGYDKDMHAFGPDSAALLRMSVGYRGKPDEPPTRLSWMRDVLAAYEGGIGGWEKSEHTEIVQQLKSNLGPVAPPPSVPTPAGPTKSATTDPATVAGELAEKDRATYERAHAAWKESNHATAWKLAAPLFEEYPNVYGLQDFRCQVAMQLGLGANRLRKECARLMALSTGKP